MLMLMLMKGPGTTTSIPVCVPSSEFCCGTLATNSCVSYSDALSSISGSELDLSSVVIDGFTIDAFKNLNYITALYMYLAQLKKLPSSLFSEMTNLQYLYLNNNNQLTSLPADIFQGLTNLQELYLDSNQLTSLDAGIFQGLTNLQRLYLNNNQLTSLDAGIFLGMRKLQ